MSSLSGTSVPAIAESHAQCGTEELERRHVPTVLTTEPLDGGRQSTTYRHGTVGQHEA